MQKKKRRENTTYLKELTQKGVFSALIKDSDYERYIRSDKWRNIAKERAKIDGFKCVCCDCIGTNNNPLECHHISYRHLFCEDQEDYIYTDLVTLCRNCHTSLHRILNRTTSINGRQGWKNDCNIPKIHTFNLNGNTEVLKL